METLKACQAALPVDMPDLFTLLVSDVVIFAQRASGIRLRCYQEAVARAVISSVRDKRGDTIVVVFPRQSGKNELQAQIEAYLLLLAYRRDFEIVKVSPTWKPQTQNAMRRLERILNTNLLTQGCWWKESGYIYRVGKSRITFLSGSPTTNVVGATASLLLECDEAQDVLPEKWDKDFAPMAASTNATRLFWGTAWTETTLLAREMRQAKLDEARDGRQRVFFVTADTVAQEVPAYGKFVAQQVASLGREHPVVKTQYFGETIDALSGMFPAQRLAFMQGSHAAEDAPQPGAMYAFLLDVGGEELEGSAWHAPGGNTTNQPDALLREEVGNGEEQRDSTALTIVRLDFTGLEGSPPGASESPGTHTPHRDEGRNASGEMLYRVVNRYKWTGISHTVLYGQLLALAESWQPCMLVVDATGIGAGLASFLGRALPGQVIPFVFNQKTKSELGWSFLTIVETGRYREHRLPCAADGGDGSRLRRLQAEFFRQAQACQVEVLPGPEKRLRWGVPQSGVGMPAVTARHDDLLLSAALCAALERQKWGSAESAVIHSRDPFQGMLEAF